MILFWFGLLSRSGLDAESGAEERKVAKNYLLRQTDSGERGKQPKDKSYSKRYRCIGYVPSFVEIVGFVVSIVKSDDNRYYCSGWEYAAAEDARHEPVWIRYFPAEIDPCMDLDKDCCQDRTHGAHNHGHKRIVDKCPQYGQVYQAAKGSKFDILDIDGTPDDGGHGHGGKHAWWDGDEDVEEGEILIWIESVVGVQDIVEHADRNGHSQQNEDSCKKLIFKTMAILITSISLLIIPKWAEKVLRDRLNFAIDHQERIAESSSKAEHPAALQIIINFNFGDIVEILQNAIVEIVAEVESAIE